MKKQMQERPGTWRLAIGLVLILCAQVGLATTQDVSAATAYEVVAAVEQDLLFAQLVDQDIESVTTTPSRTVGVRFVGPAPSGSAGRIFNTRDDATDPTVFYASIQAAIDDANDGDVIILETLASGNTVYRERIDFRGKAITLRSGSIDNPDDPTVYPETTFLVGDVSEGSVVTFADGEGPDSVLVGLTVGWGTASDGGGIAIEDASPTIRDCVVTNNQAKYYGGGIDCLGGAPTIINCIISENEVTGVTGVGGGINCQDASPTISDCVIRNNSSMSLGGGLGCYEASPTVSNCFFINNTATYGSGQIDVEDASPTITNCTLIVDEEPPGNGGIWCSGQSDPVISNCILWGNGDDLFACLASYSCIEDGDPGQGNTNADPQLIEGPLGMYYLSQLAAGQLVQSPCVDAGDPDTDAVLAEQLLTLTTRTDGVVDANTVDMGAHYEVMAPEMFPLTITIMAVDGTGAPVDPNGAAGTVTPDSGSFREYSILELTAEPAEGYRLKQWLTTTGTEIEPNQTIALPVNGPISLIVVFEEIPMYELRTAVEGGHGSVMPDHRRGQLYPDGTVVTLTAEPADGYIVDSWTGTDNDALWTNGNTITLHADTEVTVKFRQPKTLQVPAQFHTILAAMDAASDHGDKIVVGRGTYSTYGIDFQGKAVTLASQNPDDPECVAATVIDCDQMGRAFVFRSGEGPDSVIDGFTIRNGSAVYDPTTPSDGGGTGTAGADAFGGAVACFNGSSPTLSNLIIEDCVAQGQNGEDGSFVFDPIPAPAAPEAPADPAPALDDPAEPAPDRSDPNAPVPGEPGAAGAAGADGADGPAGADGAVGYDGGRGGHGYGGAMYFDPNCAPTILHCTIRNCGAFGGNGGAGGAGQDGGDGGTGQDGQVGQDGQNGGPGLNDGPDGNGGNGGKGGNGGNGGDGGIGGNGGKGGDGGEALGGAIYFGANCQPTILDCTIHNCETLQGLGNVGGAGGAGGAAGDGGVAAEGGAAGSGEADGEDGAAGTDGVGGNGGAGGIGGSMGVNGLRSWGGAIFFSENCDITMERTAISSHAARSIVATMAYDGGAGGAGGAGGSPGGSGGAGGMGGDGDAAGEGGAGGAAGEEGSAGGAGGAGATLISVTTNFGGANAYLNDCVVSMTDVTISRSLVEGQSGGGEYYLDNCQVQMNNCSVTGNSSALDGGGQAFTTGSIIALNNCTFSGNTAADDGGGFYLATACQVDINDTTFEDNQALGANASGGSFYGGGMWDADRGDFYNGSTLKLHGSTFSSSAAAFGGGLYWYGQEATVEVTDCTIWDNTAQHGGGLYWSGGAPTIANCTIRRNTATGTESTVQVAADVPDLNDPSTWPIPGDPNSLTDPNNWPDPNDPDSLYDPNAYPPVVQTLAADCGSGGGLVGWWSDAIVSDCFISENVSRGDGGGAYFGGESVPTLKNCLIKGNSAWIEGGGVASHWDVSLTVASCTLVENEASDPNDPSRGKGGGLSCSHGSDTVLIDSILWNNDALRGPQIAIGSDSDSVYIQRPAALTVSYSDVQGGRAGVHVEPDRTLNWLDGNLNTNPLFTASYFLSQVDAGQNQDSPLLDAGSDLAVRLGLDTYSTRLDGLGDTGTVDIGFHYPGQGRYQLLVSVVGGHGTVTPMSGQYHEFAEVELVALPDAGYRVKQWIGTDDDPGWNQNTNVVTMDTGDKFVIIEFEEDKTRNILVPQEFASLEDAVAAASPGDTNIILSEGTYTISNPDGIDLEQKAVRIMSIDPNDPNKVSQTIIDCAGARFTRKRAFHFQSGETNDTLITGITIRNGYWIGAVGITGGIPMYSVNPNDANEPPFKMESGTSASGLAYGGAILCENGSSPMFVNCVIEDCMVVAAQGGNGIDGYAIGQGSDTPGYWGGDGGSGSGNSYGGAVACLSGSQPRFVNCVIRNCAARGGMGGDGGDGSTPNDGSSYESWGGDAGSAIGDGHGGAVYCENGSDAIFEGCTFANNEAATGQPGMPGADGPGSELPDDYPTPAGPGSDGSVISNGTIAGGAIYQQGANPTFIDCEFTENLAYEGYTYYTIITAAGSLSDESRVYMPGGGIYVTSGSETILDRCVFSNNVSSAVYVVGGSTVDFNDCRFSHNEANGENTGYIVGGQYMIIDGQLVYVSSAATRVDYSGGAVYIGPSCPEVTLNDCQFYSNSATANGGAVRLMSDAEIISCSFSGNKSGGNGGALDVYYDTGDPTNPYTLTVNIEASSFGGNDATTGIYGRGGAIHAEDFDAVLTDCYFLGNRAKNGGALFLTSGDVELKGGIISNNESTGGSGIDTESGTLVIDPLLYILAGLDASGAVLAEQGAGIDIGGGVVIAASNAVIEDYTFQNNTAGGVKGAGGAINFYGGYVDHRVKNCLFLDNSANREGGAIWAGLYATPVITNSTFANNDAQRLGGAIACDWDSDVTVSDSIFTKNSKLAIGEIDFGNSRVTNSLFYENADGDYGVYDSAEKLFSTLPGAELDATNLYADPLFVEGPLGTVYLSQTEAGQDATSPAVDAGSDLAENATLALLTTRTDGTGDSGVVDLGFHFVDHSDLPKFVLTTEVVGGHGAISPARGEYYAGTAVPLMAVPESGWRIAQWAGTTDDASISTSNLVVIGPDRHVTVEFDQPRTIVVGSSPEYTSIQHAIDASADGDVVAVPAGTYIPVYPWPDIVLNGKNITLMGVNPDDPNVVASTILIDYHFTIYNVGPETIIEGITFQDCAFDGGNTVNASQTPDDGGDGSSQIGAAIYMANASPTIRNCNFDGCNLNGGNGAPGDGGTEEHPLGFDGGWAGAAYGGAVYIGYLSSPVFENCAFTNCYVEGGIGGDGGVGYQSATGGRGGSWEWSESIEEQFIAYGWDGWEYGPYAEYWKYSGYGGAIYCSSYTSPRFVDCLFEGNRATGAVSGEGGSTDYPPNRNLSVESFGGAVYIESFSDPAFTGCVFRNNIADANTMGELDDIYTSYGGSVAFEDSSSPTFTNCVFEENNAAIGGGLWWSGSTATITDCNFVANNAYHGGAMYAVDSNGVIDNTIVQRNLAFLANVDANLVSDPNVGFGGVMSWGGGLCAINSPMMVYNSIFTENRAQSSGGGLYLAGSDQDITISPVVHNCLIYGNSAGRDGGGISTWKSEPMISSCTIADNLVTGALGVAYGGGLFVAYDSNAVMTDSIIWGNTSSQEGSQIAVASGFEYGPRPSTLHLTHTDVQSDVDPNALTGTAMDLVFVIDSTDSMTNYVNAVEAMASNIIAAATEVVPDYRIAIVDYKDFNDTTLGATSDYPFRVVTQFSEDASRAVSGFSSIGTPEGAGGDTDAESMYTALAYTIDGTALGGWRSGDVKRVIILITDAPPHDPEPPTGLSLADVVGAASQSPSKRIFAVQIGDDALASVYLTNLAGATGGAVVRVPLSELTATTGGTSLNATNPIGAAVIEAIDQISSMASSIFVSSGSQLPGWDAETATWDSATANLMEDPLFIAGYYLSQVAAGQGRQSPAVDAGSGSVNATTIALADRTTRTDGVGDADAVDLGYHYVEGVTLLTLTAEVLADPNDGLIHGTVTPTYTLIYEGAADNIIRLTAVPEEGYTVSQWTGTDDDTLTTLTNTVTLTTDTHVTISFQKRKARVLTVPGDYTRIQDAVLAAGEGDTIVVDQGTYFSGYEAVGLYIDRAVTITSTNPDDPEVVGATIIDGLLSSGTPWSNVGVVFTEGAGRSTVLNGFTIQNCGGRASDGNDGDRDAGHPNGEDGAPIQGGAMMILPGASPTIKNCIFRNNHIVAGNGGVGVDADETANAGRGGWGGWARGGAIYCAADTEPRFVNCIIENNYAEGGNGGNGGSYADDGGLANYGGSFTPSVPVNIDPDGFGSEAATTLEIWRLWPWDYASNVETSFGTQPYSPTSGITGGSGSYFGDYRFYSGYGGGIYIDQRSKVEFVSCTIRGNRTYGGMSGQGGIQGAAGRFTEPLVPFEIPSYGGGVYCAAETEVTFTECNLSGNVASPSLAGQDPNFRLDPYISFGGGVAAEGTAALTFVDCNFANNVADTGGALYVANAEFTAIDCNMTANDALRGGGIATMAATLNIAGSEIRNNRAIDDVNDPNDDGILPLGAGILCSTSDAFIRDCNLAGNLSDGSGGAIYMRGQNAVSVFNCLIINNRASRDGGGISTNWYAEPTIRNCTFTGNSAPGDAGDPDKTGLGGALFCGYLSEAVVIDSILWNDYAVQGAELAVGTGFDLDPLCGTIHVSYSDIGPGPNSVFVDDGCVLAYGEGIISARPWFEEGPLGSYYLSSSDIPGQSVTSPAIDAGSDYSSTVGMSRYTTRTDRQPDTDIVDMGFHYSFLAPCRFADLMFDGTIRFDDFALFAQSWMNMGCSEADGWCDGADLTYDSMVDAQDLMVLADCWLVTDTEAPTPDRAEWEIEPYLSGSSARMTAAEAVDAWWGEEVEYYFECNYGNGHDSGWQTSRVYTDTGLSSSQEYGYRVKVRDPLGNETEWSVTRFAGGADRRPPAPAPYIRTIAADSSQAITMTAAESSDDNGVQYYFDCNTPGGHDSDWIDEPVYTDIDLEPNTVYCYRVKARDLSAALNETEYSELVCVRTQVPGDTTAPTPNPMSFDPNGLPREYLQDDGSNETPFDYWYEMMAVTATDDSGSVQYYFQCNYDTDLDSGWQDSPIYQVWVGLWNRGYKFRVRARDASGNPTDWSDWVQAIQRPNQPALTTDTTGTTGTAVGGG